MQELAGGLIPLRKLARNVPHGFKGEKLLETLASKQVPFLRATWYIKIVGLSEMVTKTTLFHFHMYLSFFFFCRVNVVQVMQPRPWAHNLFNGQRLLQLTLKNN